MSCHGARRRLSAFHDGELPTREQVAVETHLRACAACAREAASFEGLGDALRTRAAMTAVAFENEMDGLQAGIVSRLRVEREESVPAQFGRMFEDMRLGFAALGSTAASFVSLLAVVGILNFGPQSERPDSLAGVMQGMGGSTAASVDVRDLVGQQIGVPSPQDREAMSANAMSTPASATEAQMSEEDAVFALAAVVTRQGRIASLEVVRSDQQSSQTQEQILRLLDQVSRARFEPATVGGAPVAARRVWVMAHTTVRAKLPPLPKQSALPSAWVVTSVVS
jgi:hypothetical protein